MKSFVEREQAASASGLTSSTLKVVLLGPAVESMPYQTEQKMVDYRGIITIEPGKCGGKPCVRGMRITIYDVLDYLACGMTMEEMLIDLPYLTREDIQACLAFAADRERHMLSMPV
jgi:uncharacterized protein (DUF433 family)